MARFLRFMIALHDPYLQVLCELGEAEERTPQQQATWMLKQALQQVMRDQEQSLDRFLAAHRRQDAAEQKE